MSTPSITNNLSVTANTGPQTNGGQPFAVDANTLAYDLVLMAMKIKDLEGLKLQFETLQKQHEVSKELVDVLNTKVVQVTKDNESLKTENCKIKEIFEKKVKSLNEGMHEAKLIVASNQQEIRKYKGQLSVLESIEKNLNEEMDRLKVRLRESNRDYKEITEKEKQLSAKEKQIVEKEKSVKEQMELMESTSNTRKRKYEEMEKQNSELKNENEKIKNKYQKVSEAINSFKKSLNN